MLHQIADLHGKFICYYLDHYAVFSLMAEGLNQLTHLYHILHLLM